jgi:CII-binding regulator of phage lambda lysogenization HflD
MNKSSFIVAVIFIFVLGLIIGYQNNKIKELESQDKIEVYIGGDIQKGKLIDSLQNLADSLYAENYPCQIELNRYQIAYQIFMERNPNAAKQYGTIISEETE